MAELDNAQREAIAYSSAKRISPTKISREYGVTIEQVIEISEKYWGRWHELVSKNAQGPLTTNEREEYRRMETVVEKLEAEEAARCARVRNKLVGRHEEVLRKLVGLAESLERQIAKD